jgi:hypothetical protein
MSKEKPARDDIEAQKDVEAEKTGADEQKSTH